MTTQTMPGAVLDPPVEGMPLDPSPSAGLSLTAGDDAGYADANREHDWPGTLFIFLANLTAWFCVIGAGVAAAGLVVDGLPMDGKPWLAVPFLVAAVFQRVLAKGVSQFTRWGWMGAMAELAVAALTELPRSLDVGDWVSSLITVGINVLWMSYFWRRRADFDIDIDL
ncbi:MAG TPA: hypothetical protein VE871_18430 [Longimicrobium sp.]|nr:hypothetical protein [Longimicrobium sp.]